MGLSLLYIYWNVDPEIFRIGGFGLRYYSLMFVIAFYLGMVLMKKMYRQDGLSEEWLNSLLFYVLLGTVIGARLGQTLFYEFEYFKNHPLQIILPFRFSNGSFEWTGYQGLASHGGAIGIVVAVALYARKYKQSFLQIVDRLVVVVALGGFFIRIGNLFNSEIIGKPAQVPWAFVFAQVDLIPRHPAQLYEAIAYIILFFVLCQMYQNITVRKDGFLFGTFLVLVFSARFLIEFTKEDQEAFEKTMFLNMGQILSVPFVLIGIYFIIRKSKPKANTVKG